ncbi:hypothetical protein SAMN05414139_01478 [Burkholderia sp. D7]|nr:hypothetical protein SAMN05414139_01478 [Burkholderia sp. D7]
MMRLTLIGAVMLAGCAANSGVVSMGQGNFMVSRQAATGFSGSGTLKADALREANQYCADRQKELQVISSREAAPPFLLGNFPKAEVEFTCN